MLGLRTHRSSKWRRAGVLRSHAQDRHASWTDAGGTLDASSAGVPAPCCRYSPRCCYAKMTLPPCSRSVSNRHGGASRVASKLCVCVYGCVYDHLSGFILSSARCLTTSLHGTHTIWSSARWLTTTLHGTHIESSARCLTGSLHGTH